MASSQSPMPPLRFTSRPISALSRIEIVVDCAHHSRRGRGQAELLVNYRSLPQKSPWAHESRPQHARLLTHWASSCPELSRPLRMPHRPFPHSRFRSGPLPPFRSLSTPPYRQPENFSCPISNDSPTGRCSKRSTSEENSASAGTAFRAIFRKGPSSPNMSAYQAQSEFRTVGIWRSNRRVGILEKLSDGAIRTEESFAEWRSAKFEQIGRSTVQRIA